MARKKCKVGKLWKAMESYGKLKMSARLGKKGTSFQKVDVARQRVKRCSQGQEKGAKVERRDARFSKIGPSGHAMLR